MFLGGNRSRRLNWNGYVTILIYIERRNENFVINMKVVKKKKLIHYDRFLNKRIKREKFCLCLIFSN